MARRSRRGPVGPIISHAPPRGKCSSAIFSLNSRVVDLVVVPADALLRHAGRAAGLENVERLALELRRHPDLGLQVAQPFVLEVRELHHVGEALDLLARVEILLRPIEPERAAGFRRKMPRDDLLEMRFELRLGLVRV